MHGSNLKSKDWYFTFCLLRRIQFFQSRSLTCLKKFILLYQYFWLTCGKGCIAISQLTAETDLRAKKQLSVLILRLCYHRDWFLSLSTPFNFALDTLSCMKNCEFPLFGGYFLWTFISTKKQQRGKTSLSNKKSHEHWIWLLTWTCM